MQDLNKQLNYPVITLVWQLQENNEGWTNVGSPITTNVASVSTSQSIYASTNGASTGNFNWGSIITEGGSYEYP